MTREILTRKGDLVFNPPTTHRDKLFPEKRKANESSPEIKKKSETEEPTSERWLVIDTRNDFKKLGLNLDTRRIFNIETGIEYLRLGPRVAKLLECLVSHANNVVSRADICAEVWTEDRLPYLNKRTLKSHVSNLRGKLRQIDPQLAESLFTAREIGYGWRTK